MYDSVFVNPRKSIRRRSQQLNLSKTALHDILTKYIKMHTNKIQLTQALKPADHEKRLQFSQWILNRHKEDESCTENFFSQTKRTFTSRIFECL